MSEGETTPIANKNTPRSIERNGHYGIKCIAIGLSILAVLIVCYVVYFLPLPQNQAGPLPQSILTPNPIIGIVNPTAHSTEGIKLYVKWLESAGGRATVLSTNASKSELEMALNNVNGVLLPGDLRQPSKDIALLYSLIKELNENGTHFPLWATGYGMDWLLQLESDNLNVLDLIATNGSSSVLEFTYRMSRLIGSSAVLDVLSREPIASSFHQHGIFIDHFYHVSALSSFYQPLATALDLQGHTFVAAIEAFDYPFYGVHFHPETNAYDFTSNNNVTIDHSYHAILASQAFAHFFIHEARRNGHHFLDSNQESNAFIGQV